MHPPPADRHSIASILPELAIGASSVIAAIGLVIGLMAINDARAAGDTPALPGQSLELGVADLRDVHDAELPK